MIRMFRPWPRTLTVLVAALSALIFAGLSVPAQAGTITLSWDPVVDEDLGGYKIYYGTAPGLYTNVLDVGNLTQYRIIGLSDCQQQYFAVKAYDQNGNTSADFSNVITGLPDPRVISLSPTSIERGQSLTLTVNGKNFEPGVSLSIADKINVFYTSFVSCIQARSTISVSGDALLASNSATMTNPNGLRHTLASAFTVLPVTYPFVTSVSPAPGSSAVPVTVQPTITFSERMSPTTIKPDMVRLLSPSGVPVAQAAGSPVLDGTGKIATLSFAGPLQAGTLYRLDIQGGGAGARDAQGTAMLTTITYGAGFMTSLALQGDSPSVASASPSPNDVGVAPSVEPMVTFSKPMDPQTITAERVALVGPAGELVAQAPGSPNLDPTAKIATIVPAVALENGGTYSIRIVGGAEGVRDAEGLGLELPFEQRPGFRTAPGEYLPPPQITSISPADGESGVSVEIEPRVVFTQPMLPASVNPGTVLLLDPGDQVVPQAEGSPRLDACGETATLTPAEPLSYATNYRVKVLGGSEGAQNANGGVLDAETLQEQGFSTLPPAAYGPPAVIATNPGDGAQAVSGDVHPTLSFSEAMDPTSISTATVRLIGPDGGDVEQAEGSPILESSGRIVTIVPLSSLVREGSYRMIVESGDAGVQDTEGEVMAEPYVQDTGFTVELPDLDRPQILGTAPEGGDRGVPQEIHPTVTFNEPVDPSTITPLTIVLLREDGTAVPQADGSPSLDATGQMATLTPAEPLVRRAIYKLQIVGGPGGVSDLAGNTLRATATSVDGFEIAKSQYDNDDDDPIGGHN